MQPPGPNIFQTLFSFRKERTEGLIKPIEFLIQKYGPTIKIPLIKNNMYLFTNPSDVGQILTDNGQTYQRAYSVLKPLMGDSLVTADTDQWKKQRPLLNPLFNANSFEKYKVVISEEIQKWMSEIDSRFSDQKNLKIDIEHEMIHLTLAITTRSFLSGTFYNEREKVNTLVTAMLTHIVARLRSPIRLPFNFPTPAKKQFDRHLDELNELIYKSIEERKADILDQSNDMFSLLLDENKSIDKKQMRDHIVTFLIAAHDTTSLMLTWTFYLLSKYPQYQNHINNPEERKKWLMGIYHESLRLYPPIWYIERIALKDHTIGSYKVKKGDSISVSPYFSHRNEDVWKNASEFSPERFFDMAAMKDRKWGFIPYGGGQRVCIGQNLSALEFDMIVEEVIKRYKITGSDDNPELELNPLITLKPRNKIYLNFSRRS